MGQLEKAISLYNIIEEDHTTKNFIAQANARYILFGVNESIDNFPKFRVNLNEGLDSIAYSYLSVGCYFAEYNQIDNSVEALKKAATIIEYNHLPIQNRSQLSSYHILIGALSYYASCQYSKAFILLKDIQSESPIANLLNQFLSKNYTDLSLTLNEILINNEYASTKYLKIYDVLLAKSLSNLLSYLQYGGSQHLAKCIEILDDAIELSTIDEDPSLWWVFRLFRIIAKGFYESSLWPNLKLLEENSKDDFDWLYELENLDSPLYTDTIPSRKTIIESLVSNFVFREKNPIVELFISQRQSLNKVLSPSGAVVSLPTSSGKTRIAEIAILQSLLDNPYSYILYLAPFRSLAFEIEETLGSTFTPLGYKVSHLYGGAQFNSIDNMMIQDSHILIATPEKAKAILRYNDELASRIKLVIIDEGHLLGEEKRYVTNEMFTEELRVIVKNNNGKIILLSAVLPNSADISKWITSNEKQIAKSDWRPSTQRFGFLEFTGSTVNLEWKGEESSFNYSFIESTYDKKDAIAKTAYRLSSMGSVLIYVCRANMIMTQAKSIFDYLQTLNLSDINWNNDFDYKRFELSCIENDINGEILKYAQKGIMCHSNALPAEIRLSMERLLRSGKAKYIISTSTLAQGVNLGVSTVIIANVFVSGKNRIQSRDFWNISGRAGRAFVDTEGKVLYVIDQTGKYSNWHKTIANEYFDHNKLESATSGLLTHIVKIKNTALSCDIEFEHLLELIAENNFSQEFEYSKQLGIIDFFDWIDDSLLALNLSYKSFDIDNSDWVDNHFRESLAYIQASEDENKQVLEFIKARSKAVKKIAGNPEQWISLASSGIPLLSIAKINELIDEISIIAQTYLDSEMQLSDKVEFLRSIEIVINQLPSSHFEHGYTQQDIDSVRRIWLNGSSLKRIKNGNKIANDYFGFMIPWVVNAISKKFRLLDNEEIALVFEEIGVLSELGLPTFWAAKIYLSGIRSRSAALEISQILDEDFQSISLSDILDLLITNKDYISQSPLCSQNTHDWIDVLSKEKPSIKKKITKIDDFKFGEDFQINSTILYCKSYNGSCYLCSSDYKEKIQVSSSEAFPFNKIQNIPGIYFENKEGLWKMKCKNPRYYIPSN